MSTYTDLNTNLVEAFGNLERLCNQIYNSQHGVTNYIDEMHSHNYDGKIYVIEWDYYITRLKEIRHKRNKLSHGEVSFSTPWADEKDIEFAIDFKNLIINRTDPLALYYKASHPLPLSKSTETVSQQTTQHSPIYFQPHKAANKSNGCGAALLIALAVTALILFVLLL